MALTPYNVAQAFNDVVINFADRTAVAFDENRWITYQQLDMLSNQAARFLLSRGIVKGDRIALSLEKSPAAYALILAALKVGAIYVALDPRNPPARRDSILQQCTPKLIFTDCPEDQGQIKTATVPCLEKLGPPEFCQQFSTDAVDTVQQVTGSDAAYIMFTSGSTGAPKGAVISHDNLLHFIGWTRVQYSFTPDDIHTHLNPLYFDNSVFDLYATFFTGGTLVPFDFESVQDPAVLVDRINTMRCTVWFSVPSLLMFLQIMKAASRANLGTLRKIIFGGEGFPKLKLKQLFEELGPQTELHNVYGPTECTCICSSYSISADDFRDMEGFPPLGNLTGHFTQHLLNENTPVALGEAGELCLGGCCVGLGYFNRPDLTAAAFIQNPANSNFREIIYRTGDLARLDPIDGKLYFVGRRDLQVKHMGYRIELEEIQHAIMTIAGIDEAAVFHRKKDDLSEIIAVVTGKPALNGKFVRQELVARIPKYMMPSKFHILERMPKNANGKTDRTALARQFAS